MLETQSCLYFLINYTSRFIKSHKSGAGTWYFYKKIVLREQRRNFTWSLRFYLHFVRKPDLDICSVWYKTYGNAGVTLSTSDQSYITISLSDLWPHESVKQRSVQPVTRKQDQIVVWWRVRLNFWYLVSVKPLQISSGWSQFKKGRVSPTVRKTI